LARHGIECPTVTGAGTGSFEFETGSGVYTELQCGSYIFMDADYGRNRDRDGAPTKAFEPSPLCLGDGDEPPCSAHGVAFADGDAVTGRNTIPPPASDALRHRVASGR
jgi:hypothetical protein